MSDIRVRQLRRCFLAFLWSIGAVISVLLIACGTSPSATEVERALTYGDPLIGTVYEVRNIRRLNGYERPEGYVVEVSAEIHILENPAEYFVRLSTADQTGRGALTALGLASGGLAKWGPVLAVTISTSRKGDVFQYSGAMTMIKSEQGWIKRPN